MALHTGAADERGGDYFGPPLNRAARLLEAAHGGQVLLSSVTAQLVQERLPDGVQLRDLGEHHLRDLARPERVYQLAIWGLPADFPPLRLSDDRPSNLPITLTSFVGREKELTDVARLLERARLVTFTGPGGTGKTRLAFAVAERVLPRFADGVFVVALAPLSDPLLLIPTVAQVLGVRVGEGQSVAETLKAYLRERRLLLLLDNFEQIVAAAPAVVELLERAPHLTVLVTSRIRLQVRGEREYAVAPLGYPQPRQVTTLETLTQYEAVKLFIERARDVVPDFAVTNESAPAVAEICHRLDGLPLAIELAAARTKVLSPEQLVARLERRLAVLTGGARDLPARQQTLRNTIAWSYDLLAPAEQTLFRRLAAFVGGCTLEAAEAVCTAAGDLPLDLLDGLSALVDASLLQQASSTTGEARFTMLETIREYAREQLEMDAAVAVTLRAHFCSFLDLAERAEPLLQGPEQGTWLTRLEAEHPNLRAALAWAQSSGECEGGLRLAAALAGFWATHGHVSEGRTWLRTLLGQADAAPAALRAKALSRAGNLAIIQGDYETTRRHLRESLTLWQGIGDERGSAAALANLAHVAHIESDFATALALSEQSLAIYRRIGDRWGVAHVLEVQGHNAWHERRYDLAHELLVESTQRWRELGHEAGVGYAVWNLGNLAGSLGDYAAARAHHTEAVTIFQKLQDIWGMALMLDAFASLAIADGRPTRATTLLAAADAVRQQYGLVVPPSYRRDFRDPYFAMARAALDDERFAAAWAEGQAMSLDAALALALEQAAPA